MSHKIKADIHNHFRTISYIPEGFFNKATKIIRKNLGQGGLVGLVNYQCNRFEQFSESLGEERIKIGTEKNFNALYIPNKDITIIKGQEIPTKEGDLLVYGISANDFLKSGRSLQDTAKDAKEKYNAFVVAQTGVQGTIEAIKNNPKLLMYVDAIEIWNGGANFPIPGKNPLDANKKAEQLYFELKKQNNLGSVVTSDGHSLHEIGSSYNLISRPNLKNPETLNTSLIQEFKKERTASEEKRGKINSLMQTPIHIAEILSLPFLHLLGIDENKGTVPKEVLEN